jgi:ech hydrogenase subunit D
MPDVQNIVNIDISELIDKVAQFKGKGFRLVQICCTTLDCFELQYTFDKDFEFISLKFKVAYKSIQIPSISSIYPCSFIYENEINDLFGLNITGIALDYKGNLYRTSVKAAFSTVNKEGV